MYTHRINECGIKHFQGESKLLNLKDLPLVDEASSSKWPHTIGQHKLDSGLCLKEKNKKNTKLLGMRVGLRGTKGMNGG